MDVDRLVDQAKKRCPKKMYNGPCGGSYEGKCELGGICSWAKVCGKIRDMGMEEKLLNLFGTDLNEEERVKHTPPDFFKNDFVITTELAPPAKPDLEKLHYQIKSLKRLKVRVDAVNVTDNPLGIPHMDGLAVAIELKKNGLEPIYQLTCRNRTKEILISKLLAAKAFGIKYALALTGDYPKKYRPAFFQLDSCLLVHLIKTHEKLDGLCVGVALNPHAKPFENELLKFRKKMKYADFAQTQPVFDISSLEKFAKQVKDFESKILVGVLPLTSVEIVRVLNNVPGIRIPESLAKEVKAEGAEAAIVQSRSLVDAIKELGFRGAHIMCFNDYSMVEKIVN